MPMGGEFGMTCNKKNKQQVGLFDQIKNAAAQYVRQVSERLPNPRLAGQC